MKKTCLVKTGIYKYLSPFNKNSKIIFMINVQFVEKEM